MSRKLGRKIGHRRALLKNLGISLVMHERITTTLPKAKELRPLIERWITIAKKPEASSLQAQRLLLSRVGDKDAVKKLTRDLAGRAKSRVGGYTRILKLGNRVGDASPIAIIELVDKKAVVKVKEAKTKDAKAEVKKDK